MYPRQLGFNVPTGLLVEPAGLIEMPPQVTVDSSFPAHSRSLGAPSVGTGYPYL